jgi:spore coat protein U-like protein
VLQGAGSQPGSFQSFQVATTAKTGTLNLGAWRSLINVHATIPPQSLGLVAGTYSDTIVVTLAAL